MDFRLSEDDLLMKEVFDSFCKQVIEPWAPKVEAGESSLAVVEEMAKAGMLGMVGPEEYGGNSCTYLQLSLAMEAIGRHSGALADHLNMSNCNFILPLVQLGTEEQKKKWIGRIASGEGLCAFCLTEPNAGSDTMGMTCKAVDMGDHYVLNGQKTFITDANEAKFFMVFAVTSPDGAPKKEVTAFIFDRESAGSALTLGKIEDTMGMHGSPICDVFFDDLCLPKDSVIGNVGDGFKVAMVGLNPGRCALSSAALGMAQRAIDDAVAYAKERKMFGKTLAAFQNTQFVLAEAQARVDAARLIVQNAAVALDENYPNAAQLCAEAKMIAAEDAKKVVDDCLQLFGGYGYNKEYHIEQMYRDIRIFTIFEGTTEVQKHTVSKFMGLR